MTYIAQQTFKAGFFVRGRSSGNCSPWARSVRRRRPVWGVSSGLHCLLDLYHRFSPLETGRSGFTPLVWGFWNVANTCGVLVIAYIAWPTFVTGFLLSRPVDWELVTLSGDSGISSTHVESQPWPTLPGRPLAPGFYTRGRSIRDSSLSLSVLEYRQHMAGPSHSLHCLLDFRVGFTLLAAG